MTPNAFGAELGRLMAARGISQMRLGHEVGCSHSHISRLVIGDRAPSRQMVDDIASALSLSDDDTVRLHVLASLPERYHGRLVLNGKRVTPVDVLMTRLAQAGIGGRGVA